MQQFLEEGPGRCLGDGTEVAETQETVFRTVETYAGGADAAEGEVRDCGLQECVVDGYCAGRTTFDDCIDELAIRGEDVSTSAMI